MDTFGDRLRAERERLGLSQTAFAETGGASKPSQVRYERGDRTPDSTYLAELYKHGVDVHYLITGERGIAFQGRRAGMEIRSPDTGKPLAGDFQVNGQDFVLIRRMELSASAGNGLVPASENANGHLAFTQSWLTRHQITSDLSALVPVRGDSMAPTIPDGALVLVHAGERHSGLDGIYAFALDDEVFVKRLCFLRDEGQERIGVIIISDNPSYPPRSVSGADLARLNLAGRVRAVLTSLD